MHNLDTERVRRSFFARGQLVLVSGGRGCSHGMWLLVAVVYRNLLFDILLMTWYQASVAFSINP